MVRVLDGMWSLWAMDLALEVDSESSGRGVRIRALRQLTEPAAADTREYPFRLGGKPSFSM